jgi:hypothetical protein
LLSYAKWDIPADLLAGVVLAKPPALVSGRRVFARTLTNGIWAEPEAVWFGEEGDLGLRLGVALLRQELGEARRGLLWAHCSQMLTTSRGAKFGSGGQSGWWAVPKPRAPEFISENRSPRGLLGRISPDWRKECGQAWVATRDTCVMEGSRGSRLCRTQPDNASVPMLVLCRCRSPVQRRVSHSQGRLQPDATPTPGQEVAFHHQCGLPLSLKYPFCSWTLQPFPLPLSVPLPQLCLSQLEEERDT